MKAVMSACEEKAQALKEYGPKYQQVLDLLSRDILAGKYTSGQRFPSEAALVRQFGLPASL